MIEVQIHAVLTADDTGNNPDMATSDEIENMLEVANKIYQPIGIRFTFDPTKDLESVKRTNLMQDIPDGHPEAATGYEICREEFDWKYPEKLVIYFRKNLNDPHYKVGPNTDYSSGGDFYGHVVAENTDSLAFAHEAGHYFHLGHTHKEGAVDINQQHFDHIENDITVQIASELIKKYVEDKHLPMDDESGLGFFDPDISAGVNDTPPDAGPHIFQAAGLSECDPMAAEISIPVKFSNGSAHTYTLKPDRLNIMGYYKQCYYNHPDWMHFSKDQAQVVEKAIKYGNRRHLIGVKTSPCTLSPAVVAFPNSIHVFARGDDRNIWHCFWDGNKWSGWSPDLGAGTFQL